VNNPIVVGVVFSKGDFPMCLSVAIANPKNVLGHGEHSGHEWMVVHNGMGFRCGYVKVLTGHPWYGADYSNINADAHGGLTFAEPDVACDNGGPDNGYWVGFDCAHCDDAADPLLIRPPNKECKVLSCGEIRTQEYVESECRSLCEQAAAALDTVPAPG
jgi:hypothetical protein